MYTFMKTESIEGNLVYMKGHICFNRVCMTGLLFQHLFTMLHLNLGFRFSPVTSQSLSILQNVLTFPIQGKYK